jgi:protein-disulfide isomerase
MRLYPSGNVRLRVLLESLLPLLAAMPTAYGCHKTDGGAQTSPAPGAVVTMPATASEATNRAEQVYWEHTKWVSNVPVGHAPVLGPPDALVTIVEFSEFSCATCPAAEAMLKALRSKHGDKLRLAWKNAPQEFRAASEPAAEAALEVRAQKGEPAFWDAHDRFLANESELLNGKAADVDAIVQIAREAGADADRVRTAIARHAYKAEIEEDLDLAEDLNVETTPFFFINGRRLEGTQPQERFERMIDEEIQKAQDVVARGTPPSDVYETMVKDGPGPWQPAYMPLPQSLPAGDPTLGSPNATTTVHMWSDYQCANCSAVERMMFALQKDYGDRIRFVWHDLPLPRHKDARRMAHAGREAYEQKGARGFWAMHDAIANHPEVPTSSDLDAFAGNLKLDMSRWNAALGGSTHTSEIAADERAAAEDGILETPAFLVTAGKSKQGTFVSATEYASKLRRVVERALDEATAER